MFYFHFCELPCGPCNHTCEMSLICSACCGPGNKKFPRCLCACGFIMLYYLPFHCSIFDCIILHHILHDFWHLCESHRAPKAQHHSRAFTKMLVYLADGPTIDQLLVPGRRSSQAAKHVQSLCHEHVENIEKRQGSLGSCESPASHLLVLQGDTMLCPCHLPPYAPSTPLCWLIEHDRTTVLHKCAQRETLR